MSIGWNEEIKKELGACGSNVFIGPGVRFSDPSKVILHDNVRIDCDVLITTQLEAGPYVQICSGAKFLGGLGTKVTLKSWTYVGYNSVIICGSESYDELVNDWWLTKSSSYKADIVFNEYSGVASNCTVFPGIEFPEGCRIGASSLIHNSKKLKSWSILYGTPLRFAREINKEKIISDSLNQDNIKQWHRCCTVICVYFGERRSINNNTGSPEQNLALFQHHIEQLRTIDQGVDNDVIIINNQSGIHAYNMYLESIDGTATRNGKIICHTRDNLGASFAAYNYAYQLYKNTYDYFCFLEDDVIITEPGVYKQAIAALSDPSVGFVSLAPIIACPNGMHSGGGCGYTKTKHLNTISGGGELPHNLGQDYGSFENAEMEFTRRYYDFGLRLVNLPGCSPLCSNYQTHHSQNAHAHNWAGQDLKYIYKVGW